MEFKVVLFDADGVTFTEGKRFSQILSESQGISIEKLDSFFSGVFQECMIGQADLKEELQKVIGGWGWTGTTDDLLSYWFSTGDELNDQVVALIQKLKVKGVHCYMTTNQEKYRGAYLREKLSFLFENVFVSGDIGHKKKEAAFYEYVFDRIGNQADGEKFKVMLIDDEELNISAAKRFGFETIFYKDFGSLKVLTNNF